MVLKAEIAWQVSAMASTQAWRAVSHRYGFSDPNSAKTKRQSKAKAKPSRLQLPANLDRSAKPRHSSNKAFTSWKTISGNSNSRR